MKQIKKLVKINPILNFYAIKLYKIVIVNKISSKNLGKKNDQ